MISHICMKCQILFSGENKKNVNKLSSAQLAKRVVNVNNVCTLKVPPAYFFYIMLDHFSDEFDILCIFQTINAVL